MGGFLRFGGKEMSDDIAEESEQLQHLLRLRKAIADGEDESDMDAVADEIEKLERLIALPQRSRGGLTDDRQR
jgi:hypothetical protein